MSTPTPNQGQAADDGEELGPWQEQLRQYCANQGLAPPVYHIASDRRGRSCYHYIQVWPLGHQFILAHRSAVLLHERQPRAVLIDPNCQPLHAFVLDCLPCLA